MLFQNDWAHIQHAAALRRRREYAGPSLFSFFLCGAMWLHWPPCCGCRGCFGELSLPMALNPPDWHTHGSAAMWRRSPPTVSVWVLQRRSASC